MSQVTPFAITNIGWRTFLMFAIFNYANVAYSWFFLRETAGRSLEEMDTVFSSRQTAREVEDARRKAVLEGDEADAVGTKDVEAHRGAKATGVQVTQQAETGL